MRPASLQSANVAVWSRQRFAAMHHPTAAIARALHARDGGRAQEGDVEMRAQAHRVRTSRPARAARALQFRSRPPRRARTRRTTGAPVLASMDRSASVSRTEPRRTRCGAPEAHGDEAMGRCARWLVMIHLKRRIASPRRVRWHAGERHRGSERVRLVDPPSSSRRALGKGWPCARNARDRRLEFLFLCRDPCHSSLRAVALPVRAPRPPLDPIRMRRGPRQRSG